MTMAVAPPPMRPPLRVAPTDQTGQRYHTLHYNNNNAFTLKLSDQDKTAIVGFRKIEDAVRVGNMVETYFIEKKEWPDMHGTHELTLPAGRLHGLAYVFVRDWDFDELKFECTRNFIDFISVEQLTPKTTSYSLSGSLYKFEASDDFYRERIAELYHLTD